MNKKEFIKRDDPLEGEWCCDEVIVESWTYFDGRETEAILLASEGSLTVDKLIRLLQYAKDKWGNKKIFIHDINSNTIGGFSKLYLHHGFDEREKYGEDYYEEDSICILS